MTAQATYTSDQSTLDAMIVEATRHMCCPTPKEVQDLAKTLASHVFKKMEESEAVEVAKVIEDRFGLL